MFFDWSPQQLIHLDQATSTNDDAFTMLQHQPACLLWTTHQTGGRGSRGRSWLSPPGHGLALSMGCSPAPARPDQFCYPIFAAVALHEVLCDLAPGASWTLKWPNDLLLDGRKLAGILCESRWVGKQVAVVIGIGVNLKRHAGMENLPKGYAALDELPDPPQAEQLVRQLFFTLPLQFEKLAQPALLTAAWQQRCGFPLGTRVTLTANGRTLSGTYEGLNLEGNLKVRDDYHQLHQIAQNCDDFALTPL
ncbi:biotin--[acetyl-CoA-carboxylase] ligase [Acanthopleuribacter pedis]|uniref:Biotin--[acetyl-CoA-carboxylase] ligase n=1 Tax=Acanthopleuribacter pedis TaxID=442870 RepID=A0A8J7U7C1_9BACT|nr:biotin--[acetyl-CoA-carboxylase] ligase [Acanthopleuribacter pedis]MBO1322348.1 biotin--[acetyl-CoA-carboxylase] ligase [Acanthopleuribacter pedis]